MIIAYICKERLISFMYCFFAAICCCKFKFYGSKCYGLNIHVFFGFRPYFLYSQKCLAKFYSCCPYLFCLLLPWFVRNVLNQFLGMTFGSFVESIQIRYVCCKFESTAVETSETLIRRSYIMQSTSHQGCHPQNIQLSPLKFPDPSEKTRETSIRVYSVCFEIF